MTLVWRNYSTWVVADSCDSDSFAADTPAVVVADASAVVFLAVVVRVADSSAADYVVDARN